MGKSLSLWILFFLPSLRKLKNSQTFEENLKKKKEMASTGAFSGGSSSTNDVELSDILFLLPMLLCPFLVYIFYVFTSFLPLPFPIY